jgi:hypothetical protein
MRFPWIIARLEKSGLAMQRVPLIVNTRSRSGETAFLRALDLLYSWDVPLGATYALRDPARLPETVQQAVADDHDLVTLGGDDGSVSSANATRSRASSRS